MLTEICAEIKNYFSLDEDKIFGEFAVVDGAITPPFSLEENQYYRIVGSVLNDGVHKQDDSLEDEGAFKGAIWKMRVPRSLIELDNDIEAWQAENGNVQSANMSPFTSESFGGYSYSKIGGSYDGGSNSPVVTWQIVFAKRLNPYRKIRTV